MKKFIILPCIALLALASVAAAGGPRNGGFRGGYGGGYGGGYHRQNFRSFSYGYQSFNYAPIYSYSLFVPFIPVQQVVVPVAVAPVAVQQYVEPVAVQQVDYGVAAYSGFNGYASSYGYGQRAFRNHHGFRKAPVVVVPSRAIRRHR